MRNPDRFARAAFFFLTTLLAVACSKYPADFDGVIRPLDAAGLRAQEAAGETMIILDVRTASEYRETAHAPNAVNLPWSWDGEQAEVNERFLAAVTESYAPDQPLLLLCSEGMRASQAAWTLQREAGFSAVYVYEGGYQGHEMAGYPSGPGWVADGLPVDTPAGDPDAD
jgi:rhodanese-related sulfurtransferase